MKIAAIVVLIVLLVVPSIITTVIRISLGLREKRLGSKPPTMLSAKTKKIALLVGFLYLVVLFAGVIWAVGVLMDETNVLVYVAVFGTQLLFMVGLLTLFSRLSQPLPRADAEVLLDNKRRLEFENKLADVQSANFLKFVKSWQVWVFVIIFMIVSVTVMIAVAVSQEEDPKPMTPEEPRQGLQDFMERTLQYELAPQNTVEGGEPSTTSPASMGDRR